MNARNANQGRLIAPARCGVSGLAMAGLLLAVPGPAPLPAMAVGAGVHVAGNSPRLRGRAMLAGMPAGLSAVVGLTTGRLTGGRESTALTRDLEGYSVAVSGATAVVGVPGEHNDAGSAYIYVRAGRRWYHRATLTDPNGAKNDVFAGAVAVASTTAGTYVVIGDSDPYSLGNGKHGVVYVYKGSGGTWHRQATLRNPDASSTANQDAFGGSVAISGTTLVIGAPGYGNGYGYGAAYIYGRSGSHWILQATLYDPVNKPEPLEVFGESVAVSGHTVIIGAADVTYVYTRTPGEGWPQTAKLRNPGATIDNFGASVAISGQTALVGAPGNPHSDIPSAGSAYIFTRSGSTWKLGQKIIEPGAGDEFGYSVAIAGKRILIGMPSYGKVRCGTAYEFTLSDRRWFERDHLLDANCPGDAQFGFSVALSGATALIGAPFTDVQAGAAFVINLP
jgi:hypothetical protein